MYWSNRALAAEKKLKAIVNLIEASDKEVKKMLMFEEFSSKFQ